MLDIQLSSVVAWLWWKVNGSIFLDKNAYIKELNFFLYPFTSPLFVFMPTLPFVNLIGKCVIIFAVVLATDGLNMTFYLQCHVPK